MRTAPIITACAVFFLSCQPQKPQLESGYNFTGIKAISVTDVHDYLAADGSGWKVKQALVQALTSLGIPVVEEHLDHDVVLVCSITEYNEQRRQIYTISVEDKGPAPLNNLSAYEQADNAAGGSSDRILASATTRTKEIYHIDACVGLKLRLIDVAGNADIWSSDFTYSSLDKAAALERCVTGALRPLRHILGK
jgi:hypothetical protein